MMLSPPVALTIAGSDSGGGAGIQADLATFAAHGVHGASAITAVTVQNTTGVHGIHHLPLDVVIAQIEAVLTDLRPHAVKVGMLGDADIARAVALFASAGRLPNLVVDPVLVSTSGHSLAGESMPRTLTAHLFPHAALVTPNADEAAALLGCTPATNVAEQVEQASALVALGPRAVVITGGIAHSPKGIDRVDVLATRDLVRIMRSPEINTDNDHGTGCTFASAVAAQLARGESVLHAVSAARAFVRHALLISRTWTCGAGRGPVAHTGTACPEPECTPRTGMHAPNRFARPEPELGPPSTPTTPTTPTSPATASPQGARA